MRVWDLVNGQHVEFTESPPGERLAVYGRRGGKVLMHSTPPQPSGWDPRTAADAEHLRGRVGLAPPSARELAALERWARQIEALPPLRIVVPGGAK